MAQQTGLLVLSAVLFFGGVAFYLLSVGGVLFGGRSSPNDIGVYAVTIVLLMFGVGTYMLRRARLAQNP